MPRDLPHPADVVDAMTWLRVGAPAAHRDFKNPERFVRTLLELLEALPSHHPVYCYGTPEWREAMNRPEVAGYSDIASDGGMDPRDRKEGE